MQTQALPYIDLAKTSYPLSREDVDRLLLNPSPKVKAEILKKVSQCYSPSILNKKEQELSEQIFRLLLNDKSVKIRTTLAESLKFNQHVPKDIIVTLAQDVESVATPVLTMSLVLEDQDILYILNKHDETWRYVAVSNRPEVSEVVSETLVERGEPEVVMSLLENSRAHIPGASLMNIMEMAEYNMHIAEKLACQPSLPEGVVSRLLDIVSDAMQARLKQRYRREQEIFETPDPNTKADMLELIRVRNDRSETQEIVKDLYHSDRLSASLIINALCFGNSEFFEISMAQLAHIPARNASLLIHDKGPLGFRALYNKSNMPPTMFKAIRLLLNAVEQVLNEGTNSGTQRFANQVIDRMLYLSEQEPVENLSYIIALLRQYTLTPLQQVS